MRAADFIVRSLEAHGIKRVYCVPGESYLSLLDALHDSSIEVIVCRHEGGAGFMAVAEAKLTGKPAVFLASRGPGATNASIAIHTAEQDALPVILMLGQVSRKERLRHVFQEMDYNAFFGSMAKGVFEVVEGSKLPELLPRGLRLAQSGVPGPVVYSFPEDMLDDDVVADVITFPLPHIGHGSDAVSAIQQYIDQAEKPLVIAGAVLRSPQGKENLRRFAEAQRIPVALTWKNQDVFDNGSPLYAGHLGFGSPATYKEIVAEADLILAFGTRLGDVEHCTLRCPNCPIPSSHWCMSIPMAGRWGGSAAQTFR